MQSGNDHELTPSGENRSKLPDVYHHDDAPAAAQLQVEPRSPAGLITRRIAQILLPVFVIAAAIGAYHYLSSTKPPSRKQLPQETVLPVRSTTVSFGNYQPSLILYGTTVAGRQVELRALVAGQVEKTGPQLLTGGEVNAGGKLLQINPFDYEVGVAEAKAQLAEAKAKLAETEASLEVEKGNLTSVREQSRLARRDLDRAARLGTRGTISERSVDDRELVLLQRQQAVTQSENNLKVWRARKEQQQATISRLETVLARAEKRLAETVLKAPFNAYVSDVGAQVGRMLSVNDRVATLIDRDWIDVRFSLTDGQFGRLTAGNSVIGQGPKNPTGQITKRSEEDLVGREIEVRWDIGREKLIYKAQIERIDALVAAESGGIQVYARINTPANPAPIRPGVFVEIVLPDIIYENVAKIPSNSVYNDDDNGSKSVYVISNGRLQERKVEVVGIDGADFLITGGVKANEKIMVTRISRPGSGVRVKETATNDV